MKMTHFQLTSQALGILGPCTVITKQKSAKIFNFMVLANLVIGVGLLMDTFSLEV